MKTYQHWINGQFVVPSSGQSFDSVDPYQGTAWARIARGNAEDVDRAVTAARDAMYKGPWSTMTASERGRTLRRFGDLLATCATRRSLPRSNRATTARSSQRCKVK